MDLLLDECIDQRLARELPGHNVRTVAQLLREGRKPGEIRQESSSGILLHFRRAQGMGIGFKTVEYKGW